MVATVPMRRSLRVSRSAGVTPECERVSLEGLALVEAIRRDQSMNVSLEKPRVEKLEAMLVAGFAERMNYENIATIPRLWQQLAPHIGNTKNELPGPAYGVKLNPDNDGFEYLAGVHVSSFDGLPAEFRTARIPAATYAVFVHRGHISTIRNTLHKIWDHYLPQSGLRLADSPEFERCGRRSTPSMETAKSRSLSQSRTRRYEKTEHAAGQHIIVCNKAGR